MTLFHISTSLFTHFLSPHNNKNHNLITTLPLLVHQKVKTTHKKRELLNSFFPSLMATNAFKSLVHHHIIKRGHPIDHYPSTTKQAFFPSTTTTTTTPTLSRTTTFALFSSSITPTTPTTPTIPTPTQTTPTFDLLSQLLTAKNYQQADEETRRLLIVLAGEQAVKRGYVFFSEVQFISDNDLKTIDKLWRQNSDDKFGYSVQKKIWKKMNKDFTKFFIKVGWMKKLESSEVEQFNYRAFPNEFMWEMEEGTPEGHLPLTNALRGTQLLTCIFNHPAFDDGDEDDENESEVKEQGSSDNGSKPLSKRTFKTSYTF